MTLLVHGQVASGFTHLVKLLVEGLVATVKQVYLWPVKGRVIVLVVIAVLVTQISRAEGKTNTKIFRLSLRPRNPS
jgi:hypothetical protein